MLEALSNYLQQPVECIAFNSFKAVDGSFWEIIEKDDANYVYELESYSEELFSNLCEDLIHTEFPGIGAYIDWNSYFIAHFSIEDFGWDHFRYKHVDYFIKEQ